MADGLETGFTPQTDRDKPQQVIEHTGDWRPIQDRDVPITEKNMHDHPAVIGSVIGEDNLDYSMHMSSGDLAYTLKNNRALSEEDAIRIANLSKQLNKDPLSLLKNAPLLDEEVRDLRIVADLTARDETGKYKNPVTLTYLSDPNNAVLFKGKEQKLAEMEEMIRRYDMLDEWSTTQAARGFISTLASIPEHAAVALDVGEDIVQGTKVNNPYENNEFVKSINSFRAGIAPLPTSFAYAYDAFKDGDWGEAGHNLLVQLGHGAAYIVYGAALAKVGAVGAGLAGLGTVGTALTGTLMNATGFFLSSSGNFLSADIEKIKKDINNGVGPKTPKDLFTKIGVDTFRDGVAAAQGKKVQKTSTGSAVPTKAKTPTGQELAVAAYGKGAIEGMLEAVTLGATKWGRYILFGAAKQAAKTYGKESFKTLMKQGVYEFAKGGATEAVIENMTTMAQLLVDYAYLEDEDAFENITAELFDTTVVSMILGGTMEAAHHVRQYTKHRKKYLEEIEIQDQIAKQIEQNKLGDIPQLEDYLEEVRGDKKVFADPNDIREFFQNKVTEGKEQKEGEAEVDTYTQEDADRDYAEALKKLGISERAREAVELGNFVEISEAKWLSNTSLNDLRKGIQPKMRFEVDGLTGEELEEAKAEIVKAISESSKDEIQAIGSERVKVQKKLDKIREQIKNIGEVTGKKYSPQDVEANMAFVNSLVKYYSKVNDVPQSQAIDELGLFITSGGEFGKFQSTILDGGNRDTSLKKMAVGDTVHKNGRKVGQVTAVKKKANGEIELEVMRGKSKKIITDLNNYDEVRKNILTDPTTAGKVFKQSSKTFKSKLELERDILTTMMNKKIEDIIKVAPPRKKDGTMSVKAIRDAFRKFNINKNELYLTEIDRQIEENAENGRIPEEIFRNIIKSFKLLKEHKSTKHENFGYGKKRVFQNLSNYRELVYSLDMEKLTRINFPEAKIFNIEDRKVSDRVLDPRIADAVKTSEDILNFNSHYGGEVTNAMFHIRMIDGVLHIGDTPLSATIIEETQSDAYQKLWKEKLKKIMPIEFQKIARGFEYGRSRTTPLELQRFKDIDRDLTTNNSIIISAIDYLVQEDPTGTVLDEATTNQLKKEVAKYKGMELPRFSWGSYETLTNKDYLDFIRDPKNSDIVELLFARDSIIKSYGEREIMPAVFKAAVGQYFTYLRELEVEGGFNLQEILKPVPPKAPFPDIYKLANGLQYNYRALRNPPEFISYMANDLSSVFSASENLSNPITSENVFRSVIDYIKNGKVPNTIYRDTGSDIKTEGYESELLPFYTEAVERFREHYKDILFLSDPKTTEAFDALGYGNLIKEKANKIAEALGEKSGEKSLSLSSMDVSNIIGEMESIMGTLYQLTPTNEFMSPFMPYSRTKDWDVFLFKRALFEAAYGDKDILVLPVAEATAKNVAFSDPEKQRGIIDFYENVFFKDISEYLKKKLKSKPKIKAATVEGRDIKYIEITPELRKEVLQGQTFFQANKTILDKDAPRAAVTLQAGRTLINLFEGADKTSPFHEFGHIFFEIFQSAELKGTLPEFDSDMAKLVNFAKKMETDKLYVGKDGSAAVHITDGKLNTAGIEVVMDAFERYLYEGKAPSVELTSAFQRIKEWFKAVYRSIMHLPTIDDDIRGVFDRMLASERQIQEAKAFYQAKGDITNLIEGEEEKKKELKEKEKKATKSAEDKLLAKHLRAYVRSVEGANDIASAVESEISSRPVYKALDNLTAFKITKEEVIEIGGEQSYNTLKKRYPKIFSKKAETNVKEVAAEMGYESPNDLIRELVSAPTRLEASKEYRRQFIKIKEQEIKKKLQEDDSFAGNEAYHSNDRLSVLLAQFELMFGKTKLKADAKKIDKKAYKEAANEILLDKTVSEAVRTDLFAKSEQKHSNAAFVAAQKGNMELALEHKKKEILYHIMILKSVELKSLRDKYLKKVSTRSLKKILSHKNKSSFIENDYAQAAINIANVYKLNNEVLPTDEVKRIKDFDSVLGARTPDWVEVGNAPSSNAKDFRLLSFNDFVEVMQTFESLLKTGANTFLSNLGEEYSTIDDFVADAVKLGSQLTSKSKKLGFKLDKKGKRIVTEKSGKTWKDFLEDWDASSIHLQFLFEELDNFHMTRTNGKMGPHKKVLSRGIYAENISNTVNKQIHDALQPHYDGIVKIKERLNKKFGSGFFLVNGLDVPQALADQGQNSWSVERLITTTLNLGNTHNKNVVMNAFQFSEKEIEVLTSLFTGSEWDTIQGIWDTLEGIHPMVDDVFFKMNNRRLGKVDAEPLVVRTAEGNIKTLRGGYYPLAFDRTADNLDPKISDVQMDSDRDKAVMYNQNIRDVHMRSRSNNGHYRPPLLSFQVLQRYINDTSRYVGYAEYIRDLKRIAKHPDWKKMVIDKYGKPVYSAVLTTIDFMARPEIKRTGIPLEKYIEKSMALSTLSILGGKVGVALKQQLSQLSLWQELGGGANAKYMWQAHRHIMNNSGGFAAGLKGRLGDISNPVIQESFEESMILNARDGKYNQAITDFRSEVSPFDFKKDVPVLSKMLGKKISAQDAKDFWFSLIHHADRSAATMSYLSAKFKFLNENSNLPTDEAKRKAIEYADTVVLATNPSTLPFNRNLFQQQGGIWRTVIPFMTWTSLQYSRIRHKHKAWKEGAITTKDFMEIVAAEMVASPIGGVLIGSALGGESPEWEDLAYGILSYSVSGIPIIREVPPFFKYGGFGGSQVGFKPIEDTAKAFRTGYNVAKGKGNKDMSDFLWDMSYAIGTITGQPVMNIFKDINKLVKE
jgi:hypothetical protein